jgi:hypothetical protein
LINEFVLSKLGEGLNDSGSHLVDVGANFQNDFETGELVGESQKCGGLDPMNSFDAVAIVSSVAEGPK